MRAFVMMMMLAVAVPAAAEPGEKSKDQDPNKVICRSEPVIGSRLQSTRTCLTRMQWKQQEDEQRKTVQRIQNQRVLPGG